MTGAFGQHLLREAPAASSIPLHKQNQSIMAVNFFDTIKKSFADVPVDKANNDAINTTQFLEASESLITLFGEILGTSQGSSSDKNRCVGLCSFQTRQE